MRRAIVVAAHYPANSAYPNDPHWAVDAELVAARLAQHGYRSFRVPGEEGIEGLREQLRVAPREEPALVYFAGYLLLTQTGEPALLLGGTETQTLGLKALINRVAAQLERALVVLDVRAGSETESAIEASDEVLLERALSAAAADNVDLVVRLRPWGTTEDVETRALYDVIGSLAYDARAVTTRHLVEAFERDAKVSVRWQLHEPPFILLPERQYSATSLALKATPTLSITPRLGSDPPLALTRPAVDDDASLPRPSLRMAAPPKPSSSQSSQALPEVPALPAAPPMRLSAPPKPMPNSLLPSADPPRVVLASSVPPPKPKAARPEPVPAREYEASAALTPIAIRVVVSPPPPTAPRLEPPPASWLESTPPEGPRQGEIAPETEAELADRLHELPGDEAREHRIALCEGYLRTHPDSERALEQLSEELSRSQQTDRLVAVYDTLRSRQTSRAAVVRLCLAEARLLANRLGEHRRALPAMERATELEPRNAELQLEAANLYQRLDAPERARSHYLAALRAAPLDLEVHHRLCAFFASSGDVDRAYQSAALLQHLGGASDEEFELYERRDKGALPRPTRSLVSADWMLGLEPGARDPALTTLLELVSDAALSCFKPNRERILELRARLQVEDVNASTTTLARSLAWAADLLSLPRPALYLADGDAAPSPLPIHDLAWVVGREFAQGGGQGEVVFHWARALSGASGTARVLRLFREPAELDALLCACFVAVKRSAPDKSAPVLDLALALRQRLGSEALHSLASLLDSASLEQWRERLTAFLDEVGTTSHRAGLLASGDPRIAAKSLTRVEPSQQRIDRWLGDLCCYALGDEYAELRHRLGLRLR